VNVTTFNESPKPNLPLTVQFFIYLLPVIPNSFLLVYWLLGLVLEGDDKIKWSNESAQVALGVGGTTLLFVALVLVVLRLRGVAMPHPLWLSSLIHLGLAVFLYVATLVIR
jgi:hypothetical protein